MSNLPLFAKRDYSRNLKAQLIAVCFKLIGDANLCSLIQNVQVI